ncbi:DUF423 domain-containing protein [Caryophanon tenue]|uniref:DUF423 domain-containing protein n=1 Tax=Caryophanon tenue TaxID=33978 RepID=A0A1C0Y867_9BACL|nr:DUF423 domain-containing protein [Caryophanon tenue]OCS83366.1 hypothetical protein A6M13_04905 [Caryophanon tenue]
MKKAIIAGAAHGFLAVALGAFGAHALEDVLDEYSTGIWETAIQYQMFHASGLILIGILMSVLGASKQLTWASRFMHAGIYFFSGSLIVLALSGIGVLGAITPIGGVLFLAAWTLVIIAAVKSAK